MSDETKCGKFLTAVLLSQGENHDLEARDRIIELEQQLAVAVAALEKIRYHRPLSTESGVAVLALRQIGATDG